jgi:hypothetical protein
VASFSVTYQTTDDTVIDSASPETVLLTIGGKSATGGIIDNEQPTITSVEPGTTATTDDNVVEGDKLVFNVTLSSAPLIVSTYDFAVGAGTATAGADYNATPVFSDGVTYSTTTGKITVPVGVASFSVTYQTTDDTVIDSASPETVLLTIGGKSATGGIIDNDSPPDNIITAGAATKVAISTGLTGAYYGYNDRDSNYDPTNRQHTDDNAYKNLDTLADAKSIVDGRNGSAIVGTGQAGDASKADATFTANTLNYGGKLITTTDDLGNNPTVAANTKVTTGNLQNFLNNGGKTTDDSALQATSGLGRTTDAAIHLAGQIVIDKAGSYKIRVTADDGFSLNIGSTTVASKDGIFAPTGYTFTVNLTDGAQAFDAIYYDQRGQAQFKVEMQGPGDAAYKVLTTDSFLLASGGLMVDDTHDIVKTGSQYFQRTGSTLAGTSGTDIITGSDGRDVLTGGMGADTFVWKLGHEGTTAAPARDVVTDFNVASNATGGDVINLKDLLQGENHAVGAGNLDQYLHFEKTATGTTVHVSTTGAYTAGVSNPGLDNQRIVLNGVDLTGPGSDQQIILDLLSKGKLIVD